MTDDETKTKRLTDWKPETDIKLQKAFGKFVEETGELAEAAAYYFRNPNQDTKVALESEIADCDAFIEIMVIASNRRLIVDELVLADGRDESVRMMLETQQDLTELTTRMGTALTYIGRCQIQGLNGFHPENGVANRLLLGFSLHNLRLLLRVLVIQCELDHDRVEQRKQAKIDSKLPWVMGTATDLIPDPTSCN